MRNYLDRDCAYLQSCIFVGLSLLSKHFLLFCRPIMSLVFQFLLQLFLGCPLIFHPDKWLQCIRLSCIHKGPTTLCRCMLATPMLAIFILCRQWLLPNRGRTNRYVFATFLIAFRHIWLCYRLLTVPVILRLYRKILKYPLRTNVRWLRMKRTCQDQNRVIAMTSLSVVPGCMQIICMLIWIKDWILIHKSLLVRRHRYFYI